MDDELGRPGPVDPETPEDHADLDVPDGSVEPDTAEESPDDHPNPEGVDDEDGGPGPGWIPA